MKQSIYPGCDHPENMSWKHDSLLKIHTWQWCLEDMIGSDAWGMIGNDARGGGDDWQ